MAAILTNGVLKIRTAPSRGSTVGSLVRQLDHRTGIGEVIGFRFCGPYTRHGRLLHPSSWSIKPAGTCPPASSCRPISPSFCCRRSAQSSTRSRTSGSSCATTGSPTAFSNPTTISSTIVVRHGTSSSTSLGASCPLDCANGPTGSDQWDLVLVPFMSALPWLNGSRWQCDGRR